MVGFSPVQSGLHNRTGNEPCNPDGFRYSAIQGEPVDDPRCIIQGNPGSPEKDRIPGLQVDAIPFPEGMICVDSLKITGKMSFDRFFEPAGFFIGDNDDRGSGHLPDPVGVDDVIPCDSSS